MHNKLIYNNIIPNPSIPKENFQKWYNPFKQLKALIKATLVSHPGPGCVLSPAPPHTANCIPPIAWSCLEDTWAPGWIDCVSPKYNQYHYCAPVEQEDLATLACHGVLWIE